MLEKLKQKYDKKLETDFLSEALEIVEKPASPLEHFGRGIKNNKLLTLSDKFSLLHKNIGNNALI